MLRVFVVDDEPLARKRIIRILENLGCELVGEAESGQGCLQRIQAVLPDLVFLDIEMPAPNGLELAAQLQQMPLPPAVVFLTAHPEFALEGFRAQAAGYLLKPVSQEAVQTLLLHLGKKHRALQVLEAQQDDALSVQCGNRMQRVPLQQVLYFAADGKYVHLYHEQGEGLLEASLADFEARYAERFMRVHRRYLVNRSRIERLEFCREADGAKVFLRGCSHGLEVSRRRVAAVREWLRGS